MSAGLAGDTPAAVICRGTTEREETIVGTLRDIAGRAARLSAPAVIVVGAAVALRSCLDPSDSAWSPLIAAGVRGQPRG
jgi:siroheme synthase